MEPICEKTHLGAAPIGEEHWEVSGVIPVGLAIGVPMFTGCLKGILGVTDCAIAKLVKMKPMGADWGLIIPGGLIGWEPGDCRHYLSPSRNIPEIDVAP